MSLLSASQLSLSYGDLPVFSGIGLEVPDRARIGIVGPNGGGKTSLIRVLLGELHPDAGTVSRADRVRIGYVPQISSRQVEGSLADEVLLAFEEVRRVEDSLAESALEIEQAGDADRRNAERRYSSLLQRYDALGGYDYQSRMERVAAGVGLTPVGLETPYASASGGERTRAALARALLTDPDLLVLDEPTNYLDFTGLGWLETFLSRFSHAFIAVSHDRYFLDRVVDQVWELDRGTLQTFRGNYSKYQSLKAEQTKRQQREFERQQEYIAREESFIQRYHAGQRAREARGRAKRLERLDRVESPVSEHTVHVRTAPTSHTGQVVLSVRDLSVGFSEQSRQVHLVSMPDLRLERGSRVSIIGNNGVGKTTLLETLLGLIPPLSGTVTLGHNVRAGYHRQGTDELPEKSNVLDALLDARNVPVGDARMYLARMLFRGDDVFQPVSSLSGGERTRLALARLLILEPNVLVLDEPTTHLDIPSREALEQALLDYDGTLIFVSHDRHLISLLTHQLWVIEDGAVNLFAGSFEEWVQSKQVVRGQVAKRARRRAARRAPASSKQQPKKQVQDPAQVIHELEVRLAKIERELEAASEQRDVSAVARLGEEYTSTQAALELELERWSE